MMLKNVFVSLLFNQILAWTRSQSGTTTLRAIVYMDEIFGYFPPVANPPSKAPLLSLLKTARAFGVGILLATQNPVDLDYKGLSNAGTWFLGRLQTERDKARVLDGLEGVAATTGTKFDRRGMEQILSGLGNRIFLMNNVHDDEPTIFETRWAMSYLRGPLTRNQIKILMDNQRKYFVTESIEQVISTPKPQELIQEVTETKGAEVKGTKEIPQEVIERPTLPPNINQYYIPVRGFAPQGYNLEYSPSLLGVVQINYFDNKIGINMNLEKYYVAQITDSPIPVSWENLVDIK